MLCLLVACCHVLCMRHCCMFRGIQYYVVDYAKCLLFFQTGVLLLLFFLKLQINHITSIPFLDKSCVKCTRNLDKNVNDVVHKDSCTFIQLEDTSWCDSAVKKRKKQSTTLAVRLQLV